MSDHCFLGRTGRANKLVTGLLIAIVVILMVLPFALNPSSEFSGTDNAAAKAIAEIDREAKPWFTPIWSPPGTEVASMLFALQAAVGAGVIGYYFGFKHGEKRSARH